jgi:hypothetical protein
VRAAGVKLGSGDPRPCKSVLVHAARYRWAPSSVGLRRSGTEWHRGGLPVVRRFAALPLPHPRRCGHLSDAGKGLPGLPDWRPTDMRAPRPGKPVRADARLQPIAARRTRWRGPAELARSRLRRRAHA